MKTRLGPMPSLMNFKEFEKEFLKMYSDLRGQYDVLEGLWPDNFLKQEREGFANAMIGWNFCFDSLTTVVVEQTEQPKLYEKMLHYSTNNPFGLTIETKGNRVVEVLPKNRTGGLNGKRTGNEPNETR